MLCRSHQTSSRCFQVSARPLSGASSRASNSLSSVGKRWPHIRIIKGSQKHLTKASRIFTSGMAEPAILLQRTLYVLVGCPLILRPHANLSLQVLDPNVKDMYFRHRWDTERFAAGMKQLEDAVHCFLPFVIALSLLTAIVSSTGIILPLRKVRKRQRRLSQVCFGGTPHLCPALTSTH